MRNCNFNILFSILCLLLTSQFLLANSFQENYFTPENILRFAEHLYEEGDYLRAAGEFQRYLYCFDSFPPEVDSVFYKIGLCYRMGKDFQKSIEYFQKIVDKYSQSVYLNDSYYQIAYSFFLMSKYKESISFSNANFSLIKSDPEKLKIQQLIGINYIYQKQWNKATELFDSLEEKAKRDSATILLRSIAVQGQKLPRKSEFLAGLMSTIIPGTGKIYCHRTTDGIISLLTIGLTGWQAYDGFRKDGVNSVKGWIYGTISAFFYVGNIYGSVVAVNIYNQGLEDKLLEKVGVTVNVYF